MLISRLLYFENLFLNCFAVTRAIEKDPCVEVQLLSTGQTARCPPKIDAGAAAKWSKEEGLLRLGLVGALGSASAGQASHVLRVTAINTQRWAASGVMNGDYVSGSAFRFVGVVCRCALLVLLMS
jgi:hypothetical protein